VPSLALYEPEIPGNAGNIARLCAATGSALHLIGRLGFSFRHPDARRAGMDYWESVSLSRHVNFGEFLESVGERRIWAFSTKADKLLWDAEFHADDVLLFGPESRGLPEDLLDSLSPSMVRIPMVPAARSLNIASAAAIGLYEALRQTASRHSGEGRDPEGGFERETSG
jgi:tRNA (cytidine/uridine-2'-O-)-methyltransferase